MTTYSISFFEHTHGQPMKRVVVGEQSARTAIEALDTLLRAKLGDDAKDLRFVGRKRAVLAGITFYADIKREQS